MPVTLNWICSFRGDPPQVFPFHSVVSFYLTQVVLGCAALCEEEIDQRYRRCVVLYVEMTWLSSVCLAEQD